MISRLNSNLRYVDTQIQSPVTTRDNVEVIVGAAIVVSVEPEALKNEPVAVTSDIDVTLTAYTLIVYALRSFKHVPRFCSTALSWR